MTPNGEKVEMLKKEIGRREQDDTERKKASELRKTY